MSHVKNLRTLLAAGVGIVAVVLGIVLLPGLGGDSKGENDTPRVVRAKLALERSSAPDTGRGELLVSLPATELNRLELTRGARVVWLRCFDGSGALTIRAPIDWPLLEEPGFPAHIHQPADRQQLDGVRRCRLTGPGIEFEGNATGRLPPAH